MAGDRLVFLGTSGGPYPSELAAYPGHGLVINGKIHIIDCGDGIARQVVMAGLNLLDLRHIFLTHWHADHVCGYGSLLLLSWLSGRTSLLHAWGPPPIKRHTLLWRQAQQIEVSDGKGFGLSSFGRTVRTHELDVREPRVIVRNPDVTVTASRVDHPQLRDAYAYRFDTRSWSVTFSGDTRRSTDLIDLAQGCDVLVHEVLHVPALDEYMSTVPNASSEVKRRIIESHTPLTEVGKIATAAQVKTLVLTHRVPEWVADEVWIEAAGADFKGEIVLARDFLALQLPLIERPTSSAAPASPDHY